MKRTDVEELIKQLRRNQKPGWEKTSASYLFARQRHPSEYIGTNTVAEAWNELHAGRKLDSRASIHAISKYLPWAKAYHDPETPDPAPPRPPEGGLPVTVQQAIERVGAAVLDAIRHDSAESLSRSTRRAPGRYAKQNN